VKRPASSARVEVASFLGSYSRLLYCSRVGSSRLPLGSSRLLSAPLCSSRLFPRQLGKQLLEHVQPGDGEACTGRRGDDGRLAQHQPAKQARVPKQRLQGGPEKAPRKVGDGPEKVPRRFWGGAAAPARWPGRRATGPAPPSRAEAPAVSTGRLRTWLRASAEPASCAAAPPWARRPRGRPTTPPAGRSRAGAEEAAVPERGSPPLHLGAGELESGHQRRQPARLQPRVISRDLA